MRNSLRVRLCLPPNYSYNYNFPPLGTPCLTAYLKERGYEVLQEDRNMDYLDFLSKRIGLPDGTGPRRDIIVRSLLNRLFLDKSKGGLYYAALLPPKLDEHTPYEDNTNSSFHFTERLLTSEHLERYLDDDEENTFRQYFLERRLAESIVLESDVLGLSLISPAQVLPALTLGRLVKALKPDFPIVWGGQWPSLFRMELAKWGKLHRWADAVIIDEGETPLDAYLRMLRGKVSVSDVPNLLFFERGKGRFTRKRTEEVLDELPAPDFDGMPLDRYLYGQTNGRRVLTYQTSRECYWNRCTYCVDLPFPKHTYRERNVERSVAHIKELQARYGAQELMLSDLAMAPHYMRKLSERILEEGIKVRWWTFARLDGDLNREIFDLAHRAGCYRVSYGFESASQRVCDAIDKGTKLKTMSQIVKACGSSGIKVTLQTMIGLPTETADDALETISFLLDHRDFIDTVCYNIYYLTPGNYIFRDLDKNRMIAEMKESLPFQFFIDFRHADDTGLERARADALIRYYHKRAKELKQAAGRTSEEERTDWETIRPVFPAAAPLKALLTVGRDEARLYCYPSVDSNGWLLLEEAQHLYVRSMNGAKTLRELADGASELMGGEAQEHYEAMLRLCRDIRLGDNRSRATVAAEASAPCG